MSLTTRLVVSIANAARFAANQVHALFAPVSQVATTASCSASISQVGQCSQQMPTSTLPPLPAEPLLTFSHSHGLRRKYRDAPLVCCIHKQVERVGERDMKGVSFAFFAKDGAIAKPVVARSEGFAQ